MPLWAQITVAILSILTTLILVILGMISKFSKNKKVVENASKVEKIVAKVDEYVKEAERLANTPGIKKKEFVEKMIEKTAKELNVEYDKEAVSNLIEIAVSKLDKNKEVENAN